MVESIVLSVARIREMNSLMKTVQALVVTSPSFHRSLGFFGSAAAAAVLLVS